MQDDNKVSAPSTPEPAPPAKSPYRICIVEDSGFLAEMLQSLLATDPRYVTEVHSDGLEAYHCIHRSPPDLVILDILLPSLDGLGLARLLKQHEGFKDLRILVMSSIGAEAAERAHAAGATAFLAKPYEPAVLLDLVERLVTGDRPDGEAISPRASTSAVSPDPAVKARVDAVVKARAEAVVRIRTDGVAREGSAPPPARAGGAEPRGPDQRIMARVRAVTKDLVDAAGKTRAAAAVKSLLGRR